MDYRFVRIDDHGTLGEVLLITAIDDTTALAWGRLFSLGSAVEIWCGDRRLTALASSTSYPTISRIEQINGS